MRARLVGVSMVKAVRSGDFVGVDARYVAGISAAFEDIDAVLRSWQLRALFGLPLRRP